MPRLRLPRLEYVLSACAGAVAATVLTVIFISPISKTIPERIAAEVAENHINLRPADIETDEIDDIRRFLTQLQFSPVESEALDWDQWALTGGRYCSIQGTTAAQLRIQRNEDETPQTLYQTAYDAAVFGDLPNLQEGEQPLTVFTRGLAVKIWVEKGLLFAMTDG